MKRTITNYNSNSLILNNSKEELFACSTIVLNSILFNLGKIKNVWHKLNKIVKCELSISYSNPKLNLVSSWKLKIKHLNICSIIQKENHIGNVIVSVSQSQVSGLFVHIVQCIGLRLQGQSGRQNFSEWIRMDRLTD